MLRRVKNERSTHRALAFILITLLIDGIGAGIMMPVFPRLLVEITGESVSSAASYGGLLVALFSIVQLLTAPLLGNLSDRYGRRPVLLVSLAALGIDYLAIGLAPTITWLYVAEALAGAFSATFSAASAYVADITPPQDRAKRFGLIGAVFGVGFMLGPLLGGLLSSHNTRVPFFVSAGLALLNVLYGLFVLPESHRVENRRVFRWTRANPIGTFLQIRTQPLVLRLLGAFVLLQTAMITMPVTWGYYTILKFDWSQRLIGLSLSLSAALSIMVQSVVTGYASRRLSHSQMEYIGFAFVFISSLGFAFADRTSLMLAFLLPFALGSLTSAALVSQMSNQASFDTQGELQGAIATVSSAATCVTPLLMTQLFSHFSERSSGLYFPGAPYLVSALFAGAGCFLTRRAHIRASALNAETART